MKKIAVIFSSLFVFAATILFLQTNAFAQTNQSAEWIRAQSDNDEFSVEVPADYGFFVDKTGFSVSDSSDSYPLEEVKMFNSFTEKTLIAFESYKAGKKALNAIIEQDARNGKTSEIRLRSGASVKQVLIKTDKFYTVRQYLFSKNYIYILTAASRNGETPAMKRFLNSLVFKPESSGSAIDDVVLFSALKTSQIEIDENPEPLKKPDKSPTVSLPVRDESVEPLTIVLKPAASYTEAARQTAETGSIQIRITFSQKGFVSKVGLLKTLKSGLTRQAFFAALRIKFLPQEKDEKPVTVTKVVEYAFHIY
ncbi:MAG: energy transducer TonB [Acidobacteria bacterium]|nr:energy transducer TonB [Acidobacteriota bacterium]